jgi:hypothetical protein
VTALRRRHTCEGSQASEIAQDDDAAACFYAESAQVGEGAGQILLRAADFSGQEAFFIRQDEADWIHGWVVHHVEQECGETLDCGAKLEVAKLPRLLLYAGQGMVEETEADAGLVADSVKQVGDGNEDEAGRGNGTGAGWGGTSGHCSSESDRCGGADDIGEGWFALVFARLHDEAGEQNVEQFETVALVPQGFVGADSGEVGAFIEGGEVGFGEGGEEGEGGEGLESGSHRVLGSIYG